MLRAIAAAKKKNDHIDANKICDRLLVERVERLMSIPEVGPITALPWALEVGAVQRFSSIKKAISYCGLCGDQRSSADRSG